MLDQSRRLPVASEPAPRPFRKLFTGSALTTSALTIALGLTMATTSAHKAEAIGAEATGDSGTAPSATASQQSLPDGVYLYGQSQRTDQLGAAYMVFQVTKNQVVGAFYMPSSSFDCFQGKLTSEKLALTVIDSYERTAYPYSIVQATNTTVAASGQPTVAPVSFVGYNQLQTLSKNDERMLATCQAKFQ